MSLAVPEGRIRKSVRTRNLRTQQLEQVLHDWFGVVVQYGQMEELDVHDIVLADEVRGNRGEAVELVDGDVGG